MGVSWASAFPLVHVPQSDRAKLVTLVIPYYDNPSFLRRQMAWWASFPTHLREWLSVILVDDCSPIMPASAVLAESPSPVPLRLYRIELDVRWNWLAARNIGAHHAPEGWLLMTDMDHVLPETTLHALVYGQHDPSVIYGFSRIEHTGEPLAPHPNSWFLTRQMFWTVGGYDERMSGYYGSDGHWRRRLAATAPMQMLADRLVRHEFQGDSSTTGYQRKQPQDARLKTLIASFQKGSKPTVLSFPYHEVTA